LGKGGRGKFFSKWGLEGGVRVSFWKRSKWGGERISCRFVGQGPSFERVRQGGGAWFGGSTGGAPKSNLHFKEDLSWGPLEARKGRGNRKGFLGERKKRSEGLWNAGGARGELDENRGIGERWGVQTGNGGGGEPEVAQ